MSESGERHQRLYYDTDTTLYIVMEGQRPDMLTIGVDGTGTGT